MSARSIRSRLWTVVWTDDGRARTPWRILAPLVPVMVLGFTQGPVLFASLPLPGAMFLMQFAIAVLALVSVAATTRYLDHGRSIWTYGLEIDARWLRDLLAGIVIGLAGAAVPVVIGLQAGWFEVAAVLHHGAMTVWLGLGLLVLANLCVGVSEELLFRGVFLTNAIEGLRERVTERSAILLGLLIMGIVFGALHVGSQPIEHPLYLVTWVGAGAVFGVLYLLSGDLALPIGLHAAVNIAFAGIVVRTSHPAGLPAIVRVEPTVQSPLLGFGGAIEAGGFLIVGLFAVLWLRYSRNRALTIRSHTPVVGQEDPDVAS